MKVAAAENHSLALDARGRVWTWGNHGQVMLGTAPGTPGEVPAPVSQSTGLPEVAAVAAGLQHSLAIDAEGRVWAWGSSSAGMLGTGNKEPCSMPVRLDGIGNVVDVSAGRFHSVALDRVGRVWAWGANRYGPLGVGSEETQLVPVQIPNLEHVTAVSAGRLYTLAADADGRLWAWGSNEFGGLGTGDLAPRLSPTVIPQVTGVVAVAAGSTHSLAVTESGQVWGWGRNYIRLLGTRAGTTRVKPTPQTVERLRGAPLKRVWPEVTLFPQPISAPVAMVAAAAGGEPMLIDTPGSQVSISLDNLGNAWSWGGNARGTLGTGNKKDQSQPTKVEGVSDLEEVALSGRHAVARDRQGDVWVWGADGGLAAGIAAPWLLGFGEKKGRREPAKLVLGEQP